MFVRSVLSPDEQQPRADPVVRAGAALAASVGLAPVGLGAARAGPGRAGAGRTIGTGRRRHECLGVSAVLAVALVPLAGVGLLCGRAVVPNQAEVA